VLTWLASAVWSALSSLSRILVGLGVFQPERLDARVISVGNLQAGGAGKTPLVARIANEAHERGLRVCVLCRGYGGEWESRGGVLAPGAPRVDARECGDEAALLHELAPHAWIGVGADRVAQFGAVRKRVPAPIDLVILDDGFQHWKIQKDLEIVALTSAARTQALHRDWPGALRYADLVVWTKGDQRPATAGKPCVKVRYRHASDGAAAVWLVTGVADAAQARSSIEAAGYRVVRHLPFRDHARYGQETVQRILDDAARDGLPVAVTGKDWVKWRDLGVPPGKVRVLEPELVFEEGRELWQSALWGG
jgi:tetraacyldisaccharide 4'-kinase